MVPVFIVNPGFPFGGISPHLPPENISIDYYENVVVEYLRADRSLFVDTECCIQINQGSNHQSQDRFRAGNYGQKSAERLGNRGSRSVDCVGFRESNTLNLSR